MSAEQEIQGAVDRFYEALNLALNGDPRPMLDAWSQGTEVTAMHPAGGRHLGSEEVRGAWEQWSHSVTAGRIRPEEVAIRLVTTDVAYATGWERGEGTVGPETVRVGTRATLLLRREGREWKVVHHHVDTIPALQEIVARAMAAPGSLHTPSTTAERNQSVVRAAYDAYNARDLDRAAALVADDYEGLNVPTGETFRGPEGMRRFLLGWATAFPDSRVEVRSLTAGGDRVAVEFVGRGTHLGPLAGPAGEIPPTGRSAEIPFLDVMELRDGKIARARTYFDTATMLRQLGLAPSGEEAANVVAMRRIYEVIGTGRTELLDEVMAEEVVDHEGFPGLAPGRQGFVDFVAAIRAAFPDLRVEVEDIGAAGDRVFARSVLRGTHRGEFRGIPATGRSIEVRCIDVARFAGGKGVEHWGVTDQLALLRQLGAVPAEEGAPALSHLDLTGVRIEDPAAVTRRFFQSFDAGDLDACAQLLAPGFTARYPGLPPMDAAAFREFGASLLAAFSDMHHACEEQVTEGDRVTTRMTVRFTHRGDFQGIPATGRRAEIAAVVVERIAGGRIAEHWGMWDHFGLLQQLGALPAEASPAV